LIINCLLFKNKIKILGAIIGDIVGSRFEFENYLHTDFELFTNDCEFTDDTICTIAVADALLKGITFEQSLLYWCKKYPSSYGGYFASWLRSPNPLPYNSFGNGSAMRVSPCAWLSNDRNAVLKNARLSAECTHNHPDGIKGAMAVADCIFHARQEFCSKEIIKNLINQEYGYNLNTTCDEIRKNNYFNETCQITVPQGHCLFSRKQ
jgi:ADP-ribosylglycohydrolase